MSTCVNVYVATLSLKATEKNGIKDNMESLEKEHFSESKKEKQFHYSQQNTYILYHVHQHYRASLSPTNGHQCH